MRCKRASPVSVQSFPIVRVTREIHDVPPAIEECVTRAGGLNWLGEPNFRVVWGSSRLTWIGGCWLDRDAHGNVIRECVELRRVPKYVPTDRWHVERWMPASSYGSPEYWWAQTIEESQGVRIPALGPYPSRGEYEHCLTLQGSRGEFVGLTSAACDRIVRAIEWARRQPRTAGRRALLQREAVAEKRWDNRADAILNDSADAFRGQPFVAA